MKTIEEIINTNDDTQISEELTYDSTYIQVPEHFVIDDHFSRKLDPGPESSYLTINAIDGSHVNRITGY